MACDSVLSVCKKAEILQVIKNAAQWLQFLFSVAKKKIYKDYPRTIIVLSNNAGLGIQNSILITWYNSCCSVVPL